MVKFPQHHGEISAFTMVKFRLSHGENRGTPSEEKKKPHGFPVSPKKQRLILQNIFLHRHNVYPTLSFKLNPYIRGENKHKK